MPLNPFAYNIRYLRYVGTGIVTLTHSSRYLHYTSDTNNLHLTVT